VIASENAKDRLITGLLFEQGLLNQSSTAATGGYCHRIREAALRKILPMVLVAFIATGAGFSYLLWRGDEPGGIDDVYAMAFGPPDQGSVDFATLQRTNSPNDALACPDTICVTRIDVVTPVYPVTGAELRLIVRDVAREQPGTQIVYAARWEEEDRFVVRSKLMRFPDTINARIFGAGDEGAMLALYSRSQIGYSDLGANEERIRAWLAGIEARLRMKAQQ
jgi:uncharacterized protein (DUF1499 family)